MKQNGTSLLNLVGELQDQKQFQELNWSGTFQEYLEILNKNPRAGRNAFQRIYDMIVEHGTEEFIDAKKRLIRYKFFNDTSFDGEDAIFGAEIPLMRLVNFFKAAAKGYGTEKRVLLLHGPVGSAKSTIVRRLKKGLERYSRTEGGAVYTFDWYLGELPENGVLPPYPAKLKDKDSMESDWVASPMNEEPLLLIPKEARERFVEEFNRGHAPEERVQILGELCPPSRFYYRELMQRYNGDWTKMIRHIRVRRLIFSEQDRVWHRHLPTQRRKKSGLDRTDRRYQLSKNCDLRQRQRPPRF
jgi:serine protein kinase